jgi:hypothetical protein
VPAGHPAGKLNAAIGVPKRVDTPTEKPRTDGATRKIHRIKKTWMIHLPHLRHVCIEWRRQMKKGCRIRLSGKVIVIFVAALASSLAGFLEKDTASAGMKLYRTMVKAF